MLGLVFSRMSVKRIVSQLSDLDNLAALIEALEHSQTKEYLTAFCLIGTLISQVEQFSQDYTDPEAKDFLNVEEEEDIQGKLALAVKNLKDVQLTISKVLITQPTTSPKVKRVVKRSGSLINLLRRRKEVDADISKIESSRSNTIICDFIMKTAQSQPQVEASPPVSPSARRKRKAQNP